MSSSTISAVDFVMVPVEDLERARRFYADVLGLEVGKTWGADDPLGAEFQAGNLTIALMDVARAGQEFRTGAGTIAYHVDDVATEVERLRAAGARVVLEPFDSGVCWQAVLLDSEGNSFNLHHRYAD